MRSPARRQRRFHRRVQMPASRQRRFHGQPQMPASRQRRFRKQARAAGGRQRLCQRASRLFQEPKRMPASRQLLFLDTTPLPVGRRLVSRNHLPLPVRRPTHSRRKTRTPAWRQRVSLESPALGARPTQRRSTKTAQAFGSERFFCGPPRLLLGVLSVMTVSMQRTLAALKLPAEVPALLGVAEAILGAMTNNPSFPNPSPPLAAIAAALADLQAAEVAGLARTR